MIDKPTYTVKKGVHSDDLEHVLNREVKDGLVLHSIHSLQGANRYDLIFAESSKPTFTFEEVDKASGPPYYTGGKPYFFGDDSQEISDDTWREVLRKDPEHYSLLMDVVNNKITAFSFVGLVDNERVVRFYIKPHIIFNAIHRALQQGYIKVPDLFHQS